MATMTSVRPRSLSLFHDSVEIQHRKVAIDARAICAELRRQAQNRATAVQLLKLSEMQEDLGIFEATATVISCKRKLNGARLGRLLHHYQLRPAPFSLFWAVGSCRVFYNPYGCPTTYVWTPGVVVRRRVLFPLLRWSVDDPQVHDASCHFGTHQGPLVCEPGTHLVYVPR